MNDHVHPFFAGLLNDVQRQAKQHLQGQTVVARKRDTIRYRALHQGWQECGGLISFGTFVAAVDKYEAAQAEAHLDEQYERERARDYRQAQNDEAWEREVIEARDRFAREGDVETPLGEQLEGE